MTLLDDGRIAYRVRHPFGPHGMHRVMTPVEFLGRLAAIVPLLARSPRLDWATLLRRSMDIDGLDCPRCHGRLRALDVVTDAADARRILTAAGLPAEPKPLAHARDPTDE